MRRIGTVATALLGLYVIANAITLVSNAAWLVHNFAEPDWSTAISVIVFIAAVLALAGFGVWLVVARSSISARLFEDDDVSSSIEAGDILRIGVILVGLTLLARGSVSVVNGISYMAAMASSAQSALETGAPPWWEGIGGVVMSLIQVAFGGLFVWRSRRVAAWLWRVDDPAGAVDLPATCPACGAGYDPEDYRDIEAARCEDCGSPLLP